MLMLCKYFALYNHPQFDRLLDIIAHNESIDTEIFIKQSVLDISIDF